MTEPKEPLPDRRFGRRDKEEVARICFAPGCPCQIVDRVRRDVGGDQSVFLASLRARMEMGDFGSVSKAEALANKGALLFEGGKKTAIARYRGEGSGTVVVLCRLGEFFWEGGYLFRRAESLLVTISG